ncbi:hypothetical protein [Paenibacillus hexagrammi]|uniref:YtpI-like protein n=1 Tax=Paenibacillus hexagrammi TaxID=2908839 RepID=A0ABY3SQG4_9BACL|nr:hypothetical protein [Paenibacillus sp. YPD9-1]UJF35296.1 hypothetical protein L0M14_09415 [Paenibacillus sp. YPD9-1]
MTETMKYLLALIIGVIVLAVLTIMNFRKISKTKADLTPLKKRTLLWSEISLVLFLIQLFFRRDDIGFLVFFGILTLFTGVHYFGVRYYAKKQLQ